MDGNTSWILRKEKDNKKLPAQESLFSVGNGYLGFRGNKEEIQGNYNRGTFLNGFYESRPIVYGEKAYGFPENHQTMINLPDARVLEFKLGEIPLREDSLYLSSEKCELDIHNGILHREMVFDIEGRCIRIHTSLIVHAEIQELAIQDINISSPKKLDDLSIESWILMPEYEASDGHDPRVGHDFDYDPLENTGIEETEKGILLQFKTRNSGMSCLCGAEHVLSHTDYSFHYSNYLNCEKGRNGIQFKFSFSGEEAPCEINITKYLIYSRSEELEKISDRLKEIKTSPAEELIKCHKKWWNDFWSLYDIQIEGDYEAQRAVRFNMYHLISSAGRDAQTSISAKGLTGAGYEGHYFWDTEIYMQPFFTYSLDHIAESLIGYRANHLEEAQKRAAQLSQKGAKYPWRTINGEETSAYFPAGTAQYHINADIIYALLRYLRVSGHYELLFENSGQVLKMAVETTRFWMDLGFFDRFDRFCINGVTGPDEYTALINNNFYTNSLAAFQLAQVAALIDLLNAEYPQQIKTFLEKNELGYEEVLSWKEASEKMYLPYDSQKGIFEQDDSFLSKEVWDFAGTPKEKYPLLLHFHPLVIYRYQVLKQADAIMAFFMEPHKYSMADKLRTFTYYESLTTGDSSLSACVQGIIAAQLGKKETAFKYFLNTMNLDLKDLHHNSKDGLHLAAAGGVWSMVVFGFGGLDDSGKILRFNPALPDSWNELKIPLKYQGCLLEYSLTKEAAQFLWNGTDTIEIILEGNRVSLSPGKLYSISIKPELKCIIFDLDGVITDTAKMHYQAWKQLADELDIPFNEEINRRLKGISRIESFEIILNEAGITMEKNRKKELADRKNSYYKELLKQLTPEDIFPGISELLEECKQQGIKCALASASQNAPFILRQLDLASAFDIVVDPIKIAKGKPDPEIFLSAASGLSINPRYCIGVEDAYAGVQAIHSAGMKAIGIGSDAENANFNYKDTSTLNLKKVREIYSE